jgi:uncharacterized protein YbaR (Trm112 family)
MTLDPLLIDVLACPEDKGTLLYFADEDRLYNPRLRRSYAVRDGIPVMLIDEATPIDEVGHHLLGLAVGKAEEHHVEAVDGIDSVLDQGGAAIDGRQGRVQGGDLLPRL